jgi:flagellar M-ring protein FliF
LGLVRPALKAMAQPPAIAMEGRESTGGQLDAIEAEQPERPQIAALTVSDPAHPSASEMRLEDARKLTRDNPAAVANIVKAWINGEVPA